MTEHPNLASALVAALADLSVVDKGRTANVGTYKYDYAALEDVVKRTRPTLAEHGVTALTPVHAHGDGLACTVILLHTSGERMDLGPLTFPHGKDAQATGSWITYSRRYALCAALGIAAGDDDDGAAAQPRPAQEAQPLAGWQSLDEQKAAHDDLAATIKASTESVVNEMRAYRSEHGWPMSKPDFDAAWEALARYQSASAVEQASDVAGAADPSPPGGAQQAAPASNEEKRLARAKKVASEDGTLQTAGERLAQRALEIKESKAKSA